MNKLSFKLGKQMIFRLLCCIARNLFEHFKLTFLDSLDICELRVSFLELLADFLVLFLDVVELAVERFFFLLDAAFLTLNLLAAASSSALPISFSAVFLRI